MYVFSIVALKGEIQFNKYNFYVISEDLLHYSAILVSDSRDFNSVDNEGNKILTLLKTYRTFKWFWYPF